MKKIKLKISVFSILLLSQIYCSGQTAIDFSGNDSYISVENSPEINLPAFTIECWLLRKDTGIAVITGTDSVYAIPLIAKGVEEDVAQPNMNYFLGIRREDSILVAGFEESPAGSNPGENHHITGFTPIRRNFWYHAAVTYDGVFIKLYLNGILEAALEINEPAHTGSPVNLAIGSVLLTGNLPEGSFDGILDEIRIWNYARTREEILDKINEEIATTVTGLVMRIGLNEGSGDEISYTGTPGLNVSPSPNGWDWTPGSFFGNINPPACNSSPALKIGLIADPQYCDCPPTGTRYYRETLNKLPAAIDTMNKYEVDFVVTMGDHIDRYIESYDSILPLYNELDMPDYKLLGNHEFEYVIEIYHDTVIDLLDMPDYYYDFSYPGWRFLVLDGTELAEYDSLLHPELRDEGDSLWQSIQGQINAKTWNGGIGRTQRNWIEDRIRDASASDENIILFCHFPVYPLHSKNLWNYEQIIEITEKYDNVVAYINGHNHEGNYGFLNGRHYLTQKGMIETADNNSFSVLEVYNNHLVFNSYGLMNDHTIRYRNVRRKPDDIILSNNIVTYDVDSGDLVSTVSIIDSSGSTAFSSTLTETQSFGHNSLFAVSGDSLILASSEDLSSLSPLSVKIAAMNCYLDTITKVFTINFDTLAVYLTNNIPDTTLFLGTGNLIIDMDWVITDKSRNGLQYSAWSANTETATAAIDEGNLVVEPLWAGESTIVVGATDTYTGQTVTDTFNLLIIDPLNHNPEVIKVIDDVTVNLNHDTVFIDLDTIFYDQDGDSLIYTFLFDNDSTVEYGLANTLLRISPVIAGENYLELSAGDNRGGSANLGFGIIINTMPEISGSVPDFLLQENDPSVIINLDTVFTDSDGDNLYYEIIVDDTAVLLLVIDEHILEFEPVLNGHTTVYINAYDSRGGFADLMFGFTVNGLPRLTREIGDMTLTAGDADVIIDLDTIFSDPDGDTLQYEIYTGNPEILDIVLAGSELTVSPLSNGITNIEISADDLRGGILTWDFDVYVLDDISYVEFNICNRINISNYPNPFSRETRLAYNLTENSNVKVSLYSQYGQLIRIIVSGFEYAGNKEVYVSAEDLSPGIYFCRLEIGKSQVYVVKVVITLP